MCVNRINPDTSRTYLKNSDYWVDVKTPDILSQSEIVADYAYVMAKTYEGALGYGQGKALILLSGGIDSPVWLSGHETQGLRLGYPFCQHAYTSQNALDKVVEIARKLKAYQSHIRIPNPMMLAECQMDIYAKQTNPTRLLSWDALWWDLQTG